jgi:hypothetical protein
METTFDLSFGGGASVKPPKAGKDGKTVAAAPSPSEPFKLKIMCSQFAQFIYETQIRRIHLGRTGPSSNPDRAEASASPIRTR